MTSQTLGLLIGGVLPAFLFGLSGFFSKVSTQAGIGLAFYILFAGIGMCLMAALLFFFLPDTSVNWRSGLGAIGVGIAWGAGAAGVAIAFMKFATPLSKIVPLYNMNTLVTVLLALWIFSEWKQVKPLQLLLGSLLIVIGGVLVSQS